MINVLNLHFLGAVVCASMLKARPAMAEFEKNCGKKGKEPCGIYTFQDILKIETNGLNRHYILMNEIDAKASKERYVPIGSSASGGFTGIFDGNGYPIKNLKIEREEDKDGDKASYLGFFESIGDNAVVRNVVLESPYIVGETSLGTLASDIGGNQIKIENIRVINPFVKGYTFVGGLAGIISTGGGSGVRIRNVMVDNPYIEGGSTVGALVGWAYHPGLLISCCHARGGSVKVTEDLAGGLVGELEDGRIEECSAQGVNVMGNGTAEYGAGLVGNVGLVYVESDILNSYATGNVTDFLTAGGLVGLMSDDRHLLSNCYARGDVNVTKYDGGGLIGEMQGSDVKNCFATGTVSGRGGGLIGSAYIDEYSYYSDEELIQNNYAVMSPAVGDNQFTGATVVSEGADYFLNDQNQPMVGWDRDIWTFEAGKYPELACLLEVDAGGPYEGKVGESISLDGASAFSGATKYKWSINSDQCSFIDDKVLKPVLKCSGSFTKNPALVKACVKVTGEDQFVFRDCATVSISTASPGPFPKSFRKDVSCRYTWCLARLLKKYGRRTEFPGAQVAFDSYNRKVNKSRTLINEKGQVRGSLFQLKKALISLEQLKMPYPGYYNDAGRFASTCAINLVESFIQSFKGEGILNEGFIKKVRNSRLAAAKAKRKSKQWRQSVIECEGAIWALMKKLRETSVPVCS